MGKDCLKDNYFDALENIVSAKTLWWAMRSTEDSIHNGDVEDRSSDITYYDFKKEVLCRAIVEEYDFSKLKLEVRNTSVEEAKRYAAACEVQWDIAEKVVDYLFLGEIDATAESIQNEIDLLIDMGD